MSVTIHGTADPVTSALAGALQPYQAEHPSAQVDILRFSNVSVYVRVIDPDFRGRSRTERHRSVWPLLYPLDEDVLGELSILILIPPDEQERSIANRDFENALYRRELSSALGSAEAGA